MYSSRSWSSGGGEDEGGMVGGRGEEGKMGEGELKGN